MGIEIFWGPDYGLEPGWYWWAYGCLPDGEAQGPFSTEELAALDSEEVSG